MAFPRGNIKGTNFTNLHELKTPERKKIIRDYSRNSCPQYIR